jgi:phycocyanin beta chain
MTYDAFTKVVAQADARGEFLNSGQLDALSAVVADSFKRLDAVNRITSNASKLVTNAARDLFEQQPALIAPGGSVAEGVRKIKEGALALVLDKTGITPGDCSGLAAEIGTYFDRAAAAVG